MLICNVLRKGNWVSGRKFDYGGCFVEVIVGVTVVVVAVVFLVVAFQQRLVLLYSICAQYTVFVRQIEINAK